jgi:hypothetical protein
MDQPPTPAPSSTSIPIPTSESPPASSSSHFANRIHTFALDPDGTDGSISNVPEQGSDSESPLTAQSTDDTAVPADSQPIDTDSNSPAPVLTIQITGLCGIDLVLNLIRNANNPNSSHAGSSTSNIPPPVVDGQPPQVPYDWDEITYAASQYPTLPVKLKRQHSMLEIS